MENEQKILGRCPVCGGNVVHVLKGYACVNSFKSENPCSFVLGNMIANRRMSDDDISELLSEGKLLRDGFSTKENKVFTTILHFEEDGSVGIGSIVGKCPKCAGDIFANNRAFGCGNYRQPGNPCNFTIWRNMFGHDISLKEAIEIIDDGATSEEVECFDNSGNISYHRIGLNETKEVVKL